MMATHRNGGGGGGGGDDALVPLRQWIESEAREQHSSRHQRPAKREVQRREALLRKATVAYGVAELVRRARSHPRDGGGVGKLSMADQCGMDNFSVRVSGGAGGRDARKGAWKCVKGVDMAVPALAVHIMEPSFLRGSFAGEGDDPEEPQQMGRFLEVEFASGGRTLPEEDGADGAAVSQAEEDQRCHSLGALFYELFSQISLRAVVGAGAGGGGAQAVAEPSNDDDIPWGPPARKKPRTVDSTSTVAAEIPSSGQSVSGGHENLDPAPQSQSAPCIPLVELGFPPSISLLVQNLLECGEAGRPEHAYDCLETMIKDWHLLLLDPNRFVFDDELMAGSNGRAQLSFRKHHLYGREHEVSMITDAFCRVSCGKSEAFFIGGFSGSGKSILVNSLKARVDMSDGYVITHKFDQMSKERPLLEVIAVFNELCLLIKRRSSERYLRKVVEKLADVFGTDLPILAQLIPNIEFLSPKLKRADDQKKESGDRRNLRSVCFILQRFLRAVSSKAHPVMLFLDDLQWSDNSALTLIEGILCDVIGSSCLFFVGSYRSNEILDNHDMFRFMKSLESSGVPTTKLSLEGLNPEDLNTMLSDALCTFPRICEPLSDMVFQKTKGNPYFVLEFLRSLVEGRLLEYSTEKRRWEWDEDRISSMDITGNVLYLLSTKMSGLSESIQSALKVAACFGIKIKGPVVEHLNTSSEYSHLRDGLEQMIKEGFMIKVGTTADFKFVHDKVREAAYGLIPDGEKDQYHYKLGMTLYSMTKGSDLNDVVFSIVDQINHGIKKLIDQSPELRSDLAELNEMAAVKAVDRSDYGTARSYSTVALSLLPTDHWTCHYNLSLRLYLLLAKSSYSCGDVAKARSILQEILDKCRCIGDKLSAYYLLVTILHTIGEGKDAYNISRKVLSELGEDIPESVDPKETTGMCEETAKMAQKISEESLLEMKEMDEKLVMTMTFYSLIGTMAFFQRPKMLPFLTCRMVQLTLQHGISKHSLIGFLNFSALLCGDKVTKDIEGASRIGKAAISCLKKRFQSTQQLLPRLYHIYYSFVAFHTEPLQTCAEMNRQGFDAGMSTGESDIAFLGAIQHIKNCIIAGTSLPTCLANVDYYLQLASQYSNQLAMRYLSIFRGTVLMLIDRTTQDSDSMTEDAMSHANLSETMYTHRAIQAFWVGHSERCHHYITKLQSMSSGVMGKLANLIIAFYHGLNTFAVLKRTNTAKLRAIPKNAINALKDATSHCRWNWRNKVHLLEAENFSFQGNHEEAKASYAAAITSARASRFPHEQGLACELAGVHYKKIGDHMSAWSFFSQAKQCYTEWGSQVKIESVTRQLESIQTPFAQGQP